MVAYVYVVRTVISQSHQVGGEKFSAIIRNRDNCAEYRYTTQSNPPPTPVNMFVTYLCMFLLMTAVVVVPIVEAKPVISSVGDSDTEADTIRKDYDPIFLGKLAAKLRNYISRVCEKWDSFVLHLFQYMSITGNISPIRPHSFDLTDFGKHQLHRGQRFDPTQ